MRISVLLAALILSTTVLSQSDGDVITIDSSVVVINAAVTGPDAKAVTGLKRSQFRIFEDGVEQTVDSFGAEQTPFAAVILLDTSGSMEQRVNLARSAAIEFLYGLRRDDNCAIYNFDSKVTLIQDFSNSRDIREQIFDLKADGMTALNDAVFKAAEVLSKRSERRRAIIVLSDGMDTISGRNAEKALKAALAVNANIYTVDMAPVDTGARLRMQNQGVLRNFAEKTGGRFIATPGGVAMREAFKRIVEELGGQYTLTYQPANAISDGKWRSIEVRISRPNLIIRARKGYNAPKN